MKIVHELECIKYCKMKESKQLSVSHNVTLN